MDETPGGSPGEPPQPHDEEELPQEPPPHEELPFEGEGHRSAADAPEHGGEDGSELDEEGGAQHGLDHEDSGSRPFAEEDVEHGAFDDEGAGHGSFGEHGAEPDGAEDDDDEHHTVEETELAGDLGENTALHQIDDDDDAGFDYHDLDDTDYGALEEQIHSPEELRQRRLEERAAHRRLGRQRLLALILAIAAVVVIVVLVTGGGTKAPTIPIVLSPIGATGSGPGALAAGSSAAALPGNILIADRNNNRIVAITPQGQAVWSQIFKGPSDAYPSATAHSIVVTEHGGSQVLVFSVSRVAVAYHYGHSQHSGAGVNRLHDPSTGQFAADGRIVIADKSNCRVLLVREPSHHSVTQIGTTGSCVHKPPSAFGYPDGAFPTAGGGLVVTELTPAWVDLLSKTGALVKGFQVTGLTAPYEANPTPNGNYIATNYAHPGAVIEFDGSGNVKWTYSPKSGAGELSFPTLAVVLSNGNVLVSDARNDRVIVIDPSTNQIVWQYGHTGKPGSGSGFLHTPDSAVPVP